MTGSWPKGSGLGVRCLFGLAVGTFLEPVPARAGGSGLKASGRRKARLVNYMLYPELTSSLGNLRPR